MYKLVQEGRITQEEALANADSATNLLWLLNNGPDSRRPMPGRNARRLRPKRRLPNLR
ncbi:hypothetical protein [Pseudoduganella umbonata]|uniref:Tfp pilus assembly ATPase PilU n=1 Tax=Pseudoduganella umbonata TaxID=864828 RepID=A0A7W5HD77_9BURK|nr:Tfp pilus assembly ATPase PilU [Pseudoduganella umbonata]